MTNEIGFFSASPVTGRGPTVVVRWVGGWQAGRGRAAAGGLADDRWRRGGPVGRCAWRKPSTDRTHSSTQRQSFAAAVTTTTAAGAAAAAASL